MRHRHGDGTLIVVDPRRTATAQSGDAAPEARARLRRALANGLLHILVRDRLIDEDYIRERTEGFARVRSLVASYWPQRVERITGVPERDIVAAARTLGSRRQRDGPHRARRRTARARRRQRARRTSISRSRSARSASPSAATAV